MCVCVSEEGGREGGGGRGADTELKTKTPHVNVGKNTHGDRCILNMPCLETKNAHGRRCIFWQRKFLAT